jgi:hypothetical protein
VVATLLVGAELAALGLYAQWLMGILDGSGRPTGEIAAFTATEHLEDQLAPAVFNNTLKVLSYSRMSKAASSREGVLVGEP